MSLPNKSNTITDLDKFFSTSADQYAITGRDVADKNMIPRIVSPDRKTGPGLQLGIGLNAPALDVATPAVFTPAVAVVMSVPAMYAGPNNIMGKLIKNLVESHAKSITGIDVEYVLNNETGSIVGHDSQSMAVPTKTTRTQQTPSMTMQELSGNIVYEVFTKWMWDISHPDTYVSMAGATFPGAWTMSSYSMSMLVIQFDPTMRPDRILSAAFISNMFPATIGAMGLERNLGTTKVQERSISFAPAIIQHNNYIREMAVKVASELQLHAHNYNYAPATFGDYPNAGLEKLGLAQESRDRADWGTLDGVGGNASRSTSLGTAVGNTIGNTVGNLISNILD